MKMKFLPLVAILVLAGCGSKTGHPQSSAKPVTTTTDSVITTIVTDDAPSEPSSDDEIVQNAILKFLKGNQNAVRFTERAQADLLESSWPEVQCSVEGLLDSPASFKDLVVKKVGPGLYKYEAVCPDHGDRYVDCCTMSAHVARDGVVEIDGITWDEAL